jgi:hypothetical protein
MISNLAIAIFSLFIAVGAEAQQTPPIPDPKAAAATAQPVAPPTHLQIKDNRRLKRSIRVSTSC